ncbi:MarR family transcriptional regulator [Streptomyces sp. 769]|uniref:MarR family winged helix-turn-helix transcriptional regulator n=1 Tax=Streptomyces sp. 769 TaxID=1262452 RepID=UPI0005821B18|nr:MarR family transcriptional regulator [Streptomyces sp. 769]AJC60241.1 transcriptional regulator C MarR family [Streptomyces sp. 769]
MVTRPPPAPDQPEDPAELAGRLRQVLQQLVPLLRGQSPHPDLTPSRLAALAALAAHGPLRIGELAARMNITLSTTSRMVDLLDGSGWITRRPDPADQRASLISPNAAGRALLDAVRRETAGVLAEELGRLAPGRRRQLHDALPALEELTEALRRRPAPRRPGNGRP